jgi:hypothetical protein
VASSFSSLLQALLLSSWHIFYVPPSTQNSEAFGQQCLNAVRVAAQIVFASFFYLGLRFLRNEKQILSHLQYLICRAATGAKVVAVSRWRSGAL